MLALRRIAVVLPLALVAAGLTPVAAAQAAAAPTLTIVTPTQGTTVSGLTSVKVHSTTAATDQVGDMTLYVDGKVGGGVNNCFPRTTDCTLYFLFDWSGYTGNHTEQVKETTQNGVVLASQVVTVKAVSAPPSASIVSPANGDTVFVGVDSVMTLGTIDPSQDEDFPATMALLVDGTSVTSDYCGTGFSSTCPKSLDWDTTFVALGSHTLQAKFTTSLGKTALSPIVHVTLATAPVPPSLAAPTITIDSPANGASVTGLSSAHITATTDPAGDDAPDTTLLYLDGVLDSSGGCTPVGATTCTFNHLFDLSGRTGSHTLQATMTTIDGVTVTSQVVTVTAVSPPPTVTIVNPTGGAVSGPDVVVNATGAVDPKQSFDTPGLFSLLVDGTAVSAGSCPLSISLTCSLALDWATAGFTTGTHTLQVRETTGRGNVGMSPVVTVNLAPTAGQPTPTTLALSPGAVYLRGSKGSATGHVSEPQSHAPLAGVPVQVTFTPLTGAPSTMTVISDVHGAFTASDPASLTGNTSVLATTGPDYGSSAATTTLRVTVALSCSVPTSGHTGRPVKVTCSAPGLAFGSVIALHFAGAYGHGPLYAKAKAGKVSFTVTFVKKWPRVRIWATTATTHTFVAARSRTYYLRVR